MIEINLLPEDLKKKKSAFQIPDITLTFIPILIGVAALLISVQVILMSTVGLQKAAYKRMSKEWEEVALQKKSIELAWKENLKMQKKADAIEALMGKKILWSKKLNQLSDLIMPGVWFTKLSLGKKSVVVEAKQEKVEPKKGGRRIKKRLTETIKIPYLNIKGEVSSVYGEELAIIGKFIEQLKSDPEFFKDFSNIELDSTELHSIGETEIMKFNINCYFKEVDRDEPS